MNQTNSIFRSALILILFVGFIGAGCAEKADTGITPSKPAKESIDVPGNDDPPGGGGSEIPNPTPTPPTGPTPDPADNLACIPTNAISDFASLDRNGMDKNTFEVGDELVFGAKLSQTGYFVLLNMDANKNVSIIFPNREVALRGIRSTDGFEIPQQGDRFVFNVSPPLGVDTVRLLYISTAPSIDLATYDTSNYKDLAGLNSLTELIGKSMGDGNVNVHKCDFADISITVQ